MKTFSVKNESAIHSLFDNNASKPIVYVVAVPSADFSVESVRVFADRNKAFEHAENLAHEGVYPNFFEVEIE